MKKEILEKIKQYETIIIHRHIRPDPDAYGSQGGLAEILRASFTDKHIYTVGQEDPSLHFLNRMDQIEDQVYNGALVIVCDTANRERISDERYQLGDFIIKIDHHPNEDPYGDLLWVDTSASSVSEMIYEFYLECKDEGLKMTNDAARLIYAGIVGDTGRFLYPSTTEKTFRYAAELIQYGFNRSLLYTQLYEMDFNLLKLKGFILQNFELRPSGAGSVIIKKDLLEQFQVSVSEASQLVSVLGDVKGIKAWAFFIEEGDQIRVRLRSKGPVINGLAKKYKGGGHPLAAGASVYSWDDVEQVIHDLDELCRK